MRLVYFASVREAIGRDEEDISLPADIITIADCLAWLANQDRQYAAAFEQQEKLRFALDQQMAAIDASIENTGELAIFPPVTGG